MKLLICMSNLRSPVLAPQLYKWECEQVMKEKNATGGQVFINCPLQNTRVKQCNIAVEVLE